MEEAGSDWSITTLTDDQIAQADVVLAIPDEDGDGD